MINEGLAGWRRWTHAEWFGGALLVAAALLAMLMENSPLKWLYGALLQTPVEVRVGALGVAKPLLLWINDGLMALFFLLVGLEIKREWLEGHLADRRQALLPAVAAAGGMAVPALVYAGVNAGANGALGGWAIPTATDIAFSLGVLALLGTRVPLALKVFLTTLAVLDDLGAIVVIALFYSQDLAREALISAAVFIVLLWGLNRAGVRSASPYVVLGLLLWVSVLKSGVHATLAGVVLALALPLRGAGAPARDVEAALHPWVTFLILPVFAFANAGVSLAGAGLDLLMEPVPLGIALGLLVGKPVGILAATGLAVALGWARLPAGVGWAHIAGVACLCGIGFTMSLFIGSLAFEVQGAAVDYETGVRIGVMTGSVASAVLGYLVLRWRSGRAAAR